MEELSGYNYLLGREAIQLLEIEEAVRAMGIDLPHAGDADLIGLGGMYSLKRLDGTAGAEDDALEGRAFRDKQRWMLACKTLQASTGRGLCKWCT